MMGVQKQELFILQTSGLHPYKENLPKFFVDYTLLLGTPVGTTSIQTIFDTCLRVLKNFVGYRSHDVLYPSLRFLVVALSPPPPSPTWEKR
jgi:hypothetical protein